MSKESKVLEWLENSELGYNIWNNKYRYNDETFDEWLNRVSGGNEKIRNMIFEKKFLFGGRILANRGLQKLGKKITFSNCFAYNTKFVTSKGIKKIGECNGTTVTVLSFGEWLPAKISSFGRQKLYSVIIENNGISYTIEATKNHVWYVKDGNSYKEVNTVSLSADKDQLITNYAILPFGFNVNSDYYLDGLEFNGSMPIKNRMVELGIYPTDTMNPDEYNNCLNNMYSWIAGYFTKNGDVSKNGFAVFCMNNNVDTYQLHDILTIIGIPSFIKDVINEYRVYISVADLPLKFFVYKPHKDIAFEINKNGITNYWTVKAVIDTGKIEEVYCATEKKYSSFTLDNGILTHNCYVIPKPEDNIESIFDCAKNLARTYSFGG